MKGIVDIDKGFYQEARQKGKPPLTYLTDMVRPEAPEIEQNVGICMRRFRQEDDGSFRSVKIREYAYGITGLQKELCARGIRVRGPGSDVVEKFFIAANDTPLFPAWLATQLIAGMLASSLVPYLVAGEVAIDSHIAEKIMMSDTSADRTLKFIGEGTDLPRTKITRSEGNITLYKYGRAVEASYESIRLQHLDVLAIFLQRIGMQIGIDQTDDCIETLISGDGTTGSAVVDTDAEVTGVLDYDELIRLSLAFPLGYRMTDGVLNDANLRTVLNMAEFKDPLAGYNYQRSGNLDLVMGARWHRWTSTGSAAFSTDRIAAVDNRGALILYREGTILEEADRIIDKQVELRTLSEWTGIMKADNAASQCLDITT